MDTTITISTRTGIVQYFSTIFTTPTAELFTRLVTGWVLCTAKRTITRILPFADPQGQRTHDAYHRFFPDPSWATSQLWKLLTILLVKIFHPSGVIPTDLDDTLFHHSGHKVNGAVGYQSSSERQRERRFFLHHRFESQSFRSHWWFCRPLEYRGYIQEHKAVSRWPAAPDLEAQRSRTSCCCELLALFGGVALVSPAEESPQNFSCSSLVSWQNLPELSGCFGLSSTRALATEN